MRILLIHNTYKLAGGEDAIVKQEQELLHQKGHTVELLLFNNDTIGESILSRFQLIYQTFHNSTSVLRVKEVINTFQPDVVHVHNLFYVASPAILTAIRELKVPVVMTLHNYRLLCAGTYLMREGAIPCEECVNKIIPLSGIRHSCHRNSRLQSAQLTMTTSWHKLAGTWQHVDRYIALTEFARSRFLNSSLQLRSDQVVVKPNAISDMGYADSKSRGENFLFVGRLTTEKGIEVLLESLKHYPYKITLIGEGPLRKKVEEAAATMPTIQYLGPCSRDVIAEELKRCKALVVPSLWYEGLPTTILEAYSTGTPVLCSDQLNLNEIVKDRQTGFLFPVGNGKALAELISKIDQQQLLMDGLHQCARAFYERYYTPQQSYERLLSIYEEVVERSTTLVVK
ncbi:glycosyltransferase [Spirosoma horti]